MLLNKFVKETLLRVLGHKNVSVSMVGNTALFVISVKDVKGQKIFEYSHKREGDSVAVNNELVANDVCPSEDMKEVRDALMERMFQDKKAKQIEQDRKNMRDFDIRAIEFLKQCNVR